jgi:hypothetical protein
VVPDSSTRSEAIPHDAVTLSITTTKKDGSFKLVMLPYLTRYTIGMTVSLGQELIGRVLREEEYIDTHMHLS